MSLVRPSGSSAVGVASWAEFPLLLHAASAADTTRIPVPVTTTRLVSSDPGEVWSGNSWSGIVTPWQYWCLRAGRRRYAVSTSSITSLNTAHTDQRQTDQ